MLLDMKTRSLEAQNYNKKLVLFLKESLEKKQLKILGMKVDTMVIVIFVLTLVIKLWSVDYT